MIEGASIAITKVRKKKQIRGGGRGSGFCVCGREKGGGL